MFNPPPHIREFPSDNSIIAENFPRKFLEDNSVWKIILNPLSFEKKCFISDCFLNHAENHPPSKIFRTSSAQCEFPLRKITPWKMSPVKYLPMETSLRQCQPGENFPLTNPLNISKRKIESGKWSKTIKKNLIGTLANSPNAEFPLECPPSPRAPLTPDNYPRKKSPNQRSHPSHPWKMSVYFSITNIIYKQWENFIAHQYFSTGCGGSLFPKPELLNLSKILNKMDIPKS